MKVIKIPADHTLPMVEMDVPRTFPKLNKALFGSKSVNLEAVYPKGFVGLQSKRSRLGFLVDEDGLSKNLPLNARASVLYGTHVHGAPIVGDAFVMLDDGTDWRSLPSTIGIGHIQAAIQQAVAHPEDVFHP